VNQPYAPAPEAEPMIRATQGLCQPCGLPRPAELFERDGDVWISVTCPEHGTHEAMYWRDRALFDRLDDVVGDYRWCTTFECLKGVQCDRCLEKSYNVMVEVTNACNLDCPVCCSDANAFVAHRDPTIQEIVGRLPDPGRDRLGRLRRPNIVLFGGEPTVRKDLPQLIAALVAKGYIPRVATNGTRMADEAYVRTLVDAGLRWVILQTDGFEDGISELLRGEKLVDRKAEALKVMTRAGIQVQMGCMLVQDANTNQVGDLVRYLVRSDEVFWLSFYPHSAQSRANLPTPETSVAEALAAIERETGGRITADDFVQTMKLLGGLDRVLKLPNLKQKLSTLPMILVVDGDDYIPLVRLLNPREALRRPRLLARIARELPRALRYQEGQAPPFLKFMVVEKFHGDASIDLEEAANCHMAFVTAEHFVPFDIYNIAYKHGGRWDRARTR